MVENRRLTASGDAETTVGVDRVELIGAGSEGELVELSGIGASHEVCDLFDDGRVDGGHGDIVEVCVGAGRNRGFDTVRGLHAFVMIADIASRGVRAP